MQDNFIETVKLYVILWGLLSLTWAHSIIGYFTAELFDFGRTIIDVRLISWLLFNLKREVKDLLEVQQQIETN